ncbi:MAG: hypothetical protein ACYC6Y_20380 [Thermoguttaceae bacterium]
MGSFANSLHVRSDDAEAVADQIRQLLGSRGFRAAGDTSTLDCDAGDPSVRALQVAEARDGWVGVLDNDLLGLLSLAQELSSRLQTHAICVMVNDSDSWHYELFHKGKEVDGFDSPGSSPLLDLNELPEDMLEMPDADELAEAMGTIMGQMPALADLVQALLPPEMQEIQRKITDGTATPEQAEQFSRWSRQLAAGAAEKFNAARETPAGDWPVTEADAGGNGRAASGSELENHLRHLRPLLASGVQPQRVREILAENATFAEEPMADFLETLGVNRVYAQLSYQYLADFTPEQIEDEGIGFREPLVFVRSS